MSDIIDVPAKPLPPSAQKPKTVAPVRWSFVLAWAVATFALLLALFAWLPWIYPRAGAMTPLGQISGQMQQPAVTAEPLNNNEGEDTRVKALEEKLAALSEKLDNAPQMAAVDAQTQKEAQEKIAAGIRADSIQAATQAATQTATQVAGAAATTAAHSAAITAMAPLLAAARLEDRLARGAAYQSELANLLPVLNEPEKTDLAPLAAGGPDNAVLTAQLDAQQRGLLAGYRESMAVGWLEKIRAKLSAIITITAPDSVPDEATATYTRLRAQIVQDDAEGALATLHMLPQTMQDSLQSIGTALSARAKAKAALANAITRLTAPEETPKEGKAN